MKKLVLLLLCISYCSQSIYAWGLDDLKAWFLDKAPEKLGYMAGAAAVAGFWALKERYQKHVQQQEYEKLIANNRAQFEQLKEKMALLKQDEEFLAIIRSYVLKKKDEYRSELITLSDFDKTPEFLVNHLCQVLAFRAERLNFGRDYAQLEKYFGAEQALAHEYLQQLEDKLLSWQEENRAFTLTQAAALTESLYELELFFKELGAIITEQKPYMQLRDLVNEQFKMDYAFELNTKGDAVVDIQPVAQRIEELYGTHFCPYVAYCKHLERKKGEITALTKALETSKILECQKNFIQKTSSIAQTFEKIILAVQATSNYKEQLFIYNLEQVQSKVKELEEQRDSDKKAWEEKYKQLMENYEKVVSQYNESQSFLTRLKNDYHNKVSSLNSQIAYLQAQQVLRSPYTAPMAFFY